MFRLLVLLLALSAFSVQAQSTLTPDLLWKLGRVSGLGVTENGKVIYSVSTPDWEANKSSRKMYEIDIDGGKASEISKNPLRDKNLSPDGRYLLSHKEVKVVKTLGTDFYPELTKSNAYIFNDIPVRHWDTWEEGAYDHVFVARMTNSGPAEDV